MPTPSESVRAAFYNCIQRKCTREQLMDFLDRERQRWMDDLEMLQVVDSLENQI